MTGQADLEERYELAGLVDTNTLVEQISTTAKMMGLAVGVVRHPKPGEPRPARRDEFEKWRITPIIYYNRATRQFEDGGTSFCKLLRKLEAADQDCMWSDFKFAKDAFMEKRAIAYTCKPAGLRDHVAAISVGGHHLANVYLGQLMRPCGPGAVECAYGRFLDYVAGGAGEAAAKNLGKENFNELFNTLPRSEDVAPEEAILQALTVLAELISSRASRAGALKVMSELSQQIMPTMELEEGLTLFLRKISRVLKYNSGGIYLLNEQKHLVPVASFYPDNLGQEFSFDIEDDRGAVSYVFRKCEALRFDTREQMDSRITARHPTSREARRLQSFMAAPLVTEDGRTLGVLEVGCEDTHAFSDDDLQLLRSLADFAAMRVNAAHNHTFLRSVIDSRDCETLQKVIVQGVRRCIRGTGCSIFLRQDAATALPSTADQPIYLTASTEFGEKAIGHLCYSAGEGLTGWVYQNRRCLNVPPGRNARTADQLKKCVPPKCPLPRWDAKGFGYPDCKGKPHYADKGFLAVPILSKSISDLCYGVIRIGESSEEFSRDDVAALVVCASAIGRAFDAARTSQDAHGFHEAKENVRRLTERFEHMVSEQRKMPLIMAKESVKVATSLCAVGVACTLVAQAWYPALVLGVMTTGGMCWAEWLRRSMGKKDKR